MLKTLYAKLAMGLVILLIAIGLLYGLLSTSATQYYLQQVNQSFNRHLARNLVADRNLVEEGRINDKALKETFHQYMLINPSIEIYLLDSAGKILSFSADPGKVKRNRVSLAPINAFLQADASYPLLGDDPRSHDRQKAFSVTPIPSAEALEGYLYVVLRGEEIDSVEQVVRESYFLRLSGWAVAVSLIIGLLAGLVIFRLLTRRLQRLSRLMNDFHSSGFLLHQSFATGHQPGDDEVDQLGVTFDQMAEQIRTQIEQLKEQDNLRRGLVAQVSHDLRTPLASLQGYLEYLSIKGPELKIAERTEAIDVALRQSQRLSRQVSELFELASLDARETEPEMEPFSLAELVHDVVQKYQLRAEQQAVALKLVSANPMPFVRGDIGFTERVLENLLENAFRHTPGEGQITVKLETLPSVVAVSIIDTGCGIAKTDLPMIFDPFYQSGGKSRSGEHAGLGLAIAKRIMGLQSGDVEVESVLGQGSVFTLTLPMSKEP